MAGFVCWVLTSVFCVGAKQDAVVFTPSILNRKRVVSSGSDFDWKECEIETGKGNWVFDKERGLLGGLAKHKTQIERWLTDPMLAHDVLIIDGAGKSGKSSLSDTVVPYFAAKVSPTTQFVFVNLEALRTQKTFDEKLATFFGLLMFQLEQHGFDVRLAARPTLSVQFLHLISVLSALDPEKVRLALVLDEMQFLYSDLPKEQREQMGTFLKSIIGGKKSLICVRFVFLGSNSATLYPGLDCGLYDGFHPMRDNVTISTFHRDTETDLSSMALFCLRQYSVPLDLAQEIIAAAPYKTCWHLHQVSALYPELKDDPDFGSNVKAQAGTLLEQFIAKVFEIYRRDWCCFSTMSDVLPKLYPYLEGSVNRPADPWARKLLTEEAGVLVLKDKYFQMFLYRCCNFATTPPTLSADLKSVSRDFDWSNCFLSLQLLPIDACYTLLRRQTLEKKFCSEVEEKFGATVVVEGLRDAIRAHAEAEIAAMEKRFAPDANNVASDVSKRAKILEESKKKMNGTIHSVGRQTWGTLITLARQVLAHDSTGFNFHFASLMGQKLIQDFGSRERAQTFFDVCKSVAREMLG